MPASFPMALTITYSRESGFPTLQLVGRVTDVDARDLSGELRSLCRRGHGTIVVDIGGVQFMDSHGLGVFVYYSTLMEKVGRKLIFLNTNRNPTCYINRLFEMTNLDRVLALVESAPVPERRHAPHKHGEATHHPAHAHPREAGVNQPAPAG